MKSIRIRKLACFAVLGVTGCGTAGPDIEPTTSEVAAQDLHVGSQGTAVRALHDYLTTYGYFPNEDLALKYPAWRPIVAASPARIDVYDANTERAVRELQRNSGLSQTGVVDAATRELLAEERCGVPDGMQPLDPANKFALQGSKQGTRALLWWLQNTMTGVDRAQGEAAIQTALSRWERPTAHSFSKLDSSSTNIRIRFSSTDPNGDEWGSNTLASATSPADGGDVWINSKKAWSTASSTPSDHYDLHSILAHELGHTLGLAHSSISGAVMKSGLGKGSERRSLHADDIAAGLARKIGWEQFDAANDVDIAFYSHPLGADIFVLGGEQVPGGYQIWDLENGSWVLLPGGAVRIAAQKSPPWIVNDAGSIFRLVGTDWVPVSGCATDIGMGGDGSVWITGCRNLQHGHEIRKWNGNGWTTVEGEAVRISVGPAGVNKTENVPWVVNDSGQIFRRTSSSTSSGSWEELPGLATDIAVGATGTAWILGHEATTGGFSVFIWNEQPAGGGSPAAPAKRGWVATGGAGMAIAASEEGFPYIVNDTGAYWTL